MSFKKLMKWFHSKKGCTCPATDGVIPDCQRSSFRDISSEKLVCIVNPSNSPEPQRDPSIEVEISSFPLDDTIDTFDPNTSRSNKSIACTPETCTGGTIDYNRGLDHNEWVSAEDHQQKVRVSQRRSRNIDKPSTFLDECNVHKVKPKLVATPVRNKLGHVNSNLELGSAVRRLISEGLLDIPASRASSLTHVLKYPDLRLVRSSSENSNTEMITASQVNTDDDKKSEYKTVYSSKSEPLIRGAKDKSCNTSRINIRTASKDSLIKIKFQRDLDEDSCTQYFAIKSAMNIEPYLQELRQREAELKSTLMDIQFIRTGKVSSENINRVLKQKGMLILSRPSVFESEKTVQSETDVATAIQSEAQIETVDLNESIASEQRNILSVPSEVVVPAPSLETAISSITTNRSEMAEYIPLKRCRTCRNSDTHRPFNVARLGTILEVPSKSQSEKGEYQLIQTESGRKQWLPVTTLDSVLLTTEPLPHGKAQLIMVIQTLTPYPTLSNLSNSNYNIEEESKKFKFTWTFMHMNESQGFILEDLNEDGNLQINDTRIYTFDMTPGVYLYLLKCPMAIELYNITDKEALIGKCCLKIGRSFENIEKIYESNLLLQNKDLCLCYDDLPYTEFGKLLITFRVRGEQSHFNECRPKPPKRIVIPPLEESKSRHLSPAQSNLGVPKLFSNQGSHRSSAKTSNIVSEAELQAFQDGLNLVLVRNKALRTTQEEITQELKDRTSWMHEELKWRLTLQENAILNGKDPDTIKWRQWKDDSTANVRYRPISHEEFLKDGIAHVEIEILELNLFSDSKPMLNDNIRHLYVELCFLNEGGIDSETMTMDKPEDERKIVKFQFKKEYDINIESYEAWTLAEMIKNNESIPFTVISQPTEIINELQSCSDFGIAHLELFNILQSRYNTTEETIPVMDAYVKDVAIGQLKIRFMGVLAIRSMALHLLTPQSFKIIR